MLVSGYFLVARVRIACSQLVTSQLLFVCFSSFTGFHEIKGICALTFQRRLYSEIKKLGDNNKFTKFRSLRNLAAVVLSQWANNSIILKAKLVAMLELNRARANWIFLICELPLSWFKLLLLTLFKLQKVLDFERTNKSHWIWSFTKLVRPNVRCQVELRTQLSADWLAHWLAGRWNINQGEQLDCFCARLSSKT